MSDEPGGWVGGWRWRWSGGWIGDVKASLTLTSTVDSFIITIVTVSGTIAEFVEVDTFFCPDALYVIEWASYHHLLCT